MTKRPDIDKLEAYFVTSLPPENRELVSTKALESCIDWIRHLEFKVAKVSMGGTLIGWNKCFICDAETDDFLDENGDDVRIEHKSWCPAARATIAK